MTCRRRHEEDQQSDWSGRDRGAFDWSSTMIDQSTLLEKTTAETQRQRDSYCCVLNVLNSSALFLFVFILSPLFVFTL